MLDLEGVNFVDSQGAAKLSELHELTDADGVELRLARVKPDVPTCWRRMGSSTGSGATGSTATSTGRSRRRRRHGPREISRDPTDEDGSPSDG